MFDGFIGVPGVCGRPGTGVLGFALGGFLVPGGFDVPGKFEFPGGFDVPGMFELLDVDFSTERITFKDNINKNVST